MPADNVVRHLSDRDIQVTDDVVAATASTSYVHSEAGPKLVWINEYRKVESAPAQARWQAQILPAVCRFLELPDSWDSYGGQALKLETGMFALKILNDIMGVQTPIPHLVPIATGGIDRVELLAAEGEIRNAAVGCGNDAIHAAGLVADLDTHFRRDIQPPVAIDPNTIRSGIVGCVGRVQMVILLFGRE
jgi:hypothetical protein